MDENARAGHRSPTADMVPWPVWLLLAGAIVQLGVRIAPDSYSVFGPYLLVDAEMVLDWIRSMSSFLLAAVVVLSAARWPAGRRRFLIAAAALAVVGTLQIASDAWWAIWEASPGVMPDDVQPWLTADILGAWLGIFLAHALLAGGLWAALPDRPMGRARVALMTLIALAGLVATGAGLGTVALTLGAAGSDDYLWVTVVGTGTIAAGFAALAALAIAAVRIAPARNGAPEVLIAVGAFVAMAATAWTWSFPYFAPDQAWSEGTSVWVFTIPNAAAALGMLAMIGGFGLGALAVRPGRAPGSPIA